MGYLFYKPKIRPNVGISAFGTDVSIAYRDQGYIMTSPVQNDIQPVLEALQTGGLTLEQLAMHFPSFALAIPDLIADLDKLGFLTESEFPPPKLSMSGPQFSQSLQLTLATIAAKAEQSPLRNKMQSGQIRQELLLGYAIEYFHLACNLPRLMASALAHRCPEPVYREIALLFSDECTRDKTMISALSAVGLTESALRASVPLPSTFAVYASIGTLARQHLLSFICALELTENPCPEFNHLFVQASRQCGLPDGFWQPVARYAEFADNNNEHRAISSRLLNHFPVISEEECNFITTNITELLQSMRWMDEQICHYYGKDSKADSLLLLLRNVH